MLNLWIKLLDEPTISPKLANSERFDDFAAVSDQCFRGLVGQQQVVTTKGASLSFLDMLLILGCNNLLYVLHFFVVLPWLKKYQFCGEHPIPVHSNRPCLQAHTKLCSPWWRCAQRARSGHKDMKVSQNGGALARWRLLLDLIHLNLPTWRDPCYLGKGGHLFRETIS